MNKRFDYYSKNKLDKIKEKIEEKEKCERDRTQMLKTQHNYTHLTVNHSIKQM